MAGLGIQKRGVRIARVLKAEGGSIKGVEDMSSMHEASEPEMEEARETRLEKKGYRETKAGKMVKDIGRGVKDAVKKYADVPKKVAESIKKMENTETMKKSKDFFDNKEEGWHTYGRNRTKEDIEEADKRRKYSPKFAKGGQAKVSKVMKEFGKGKLHSGKKGPVVKSRKQAIAIALSEAGMSKKKK